MRQFLIFTVSGAAFGLAVERAVEICRAGAVQPVPDMPDYIAGILTLRREVIPIIDMRGRFGLPRLASSKKLRIVMVRYRNELNGLLVDTVEGIVKLQDEQVAPSPAVFMGLKADFIEGLYRETGRVVIILRLDALLTSGERITLDETRMRHPQGDAA